MNQANQKPSMETDSERNANQKDASENTTKSATTPDVPSFGWSTYAERINGRFAMLGFLSILLVEIISHQTFLHWSGL